MGMTMTRKILAAHSPGGSAEEGGIIDARLDLVLGSDVTTPIALMEMRRYGLDSVFDPDRVVLVMDHFTPNKDIQAARNCARVREFAARHRIRHFYDVGCMGIEHALLPEAGLIAPGDLVIGADSHTCTYGALGAFSTGVGSTDMAYGVVTGKSWFRVPPAIRVELRGALRGHAGGKDVILALIGRIGVDGARYRALEFLGEGVVSLSMDDRFAVCNMAIEAGAKNGIFPVDAVTREYLENRLDREYPAVVGDPDAPYSSTVVVNLSELEPLAAAPPLPSNVRKAGEFAGLPIDQVVIGSCANGRLGDLRVAAGIIRGNKIAKGVRCLIIPATQRIYLDALREGLIEDFIAAGAAVSTPSCGPCNGGHLGVLADRERCVSTTNRNFVGRMGAIDSEIYLAGPAVAAASALAGTLAVPD
ncbi:MAG: 3-isopropylmalate dehydratase large subunit [Planctomycetota bacterium]|jgi:3-isopropylmalate/(R)-2-methylmalate dehydratase large subunit|nr:3-isopropylmalate dehydratase large subunit [Planctomycetota bacterium]